MSQEVQKSEPPRYVWDTLGALDTLMRFDRLRAFNACTNSWQ